MKVVYKPVINEQKKEVESIEKNTLQEPNIKLILLVLALIIITIIVMNFYI